MQKAIEKRRGVDDEFGVATALNNIGLIEESVGDPEARIAANIGFDANFGANRIRVFATLRFGKRRTSSSSTQAEAVSLINARPITIRCIWFVPS